MRRAYSYQLFLTVLLTIFAAITAADKSLFLIIISFLEQFPSLYLFIKNIFSICPGENNIDNAVAYIRLFAFFILFLFSLSSIWKYIINESWLLKQLNKSVHKIFFSEVDTTKQNTAYRVTYYKYYPFGNMGWWMNFFMRFHKRKRRMKYKRDYLLSYNRYGFENGVPSKNTNLPIEVENGECQLFCGSVYMQTDNSFLISIEHKIINSIIRKIKDLVDDHDKEMFQTTLFSKPIEENCEKLLSLTKVKDVLNDIEKQTLRDFMIVTRTNAHYVLSIGNGVHSNHFLGFKVTNSNSDTHGVLVIDVKDDSSSNNFYKILKVKELLTEEEAQSKGVDYKAINKEWLEFTLDSLSKIYTTSIAE